MKTTSALDERPKPGVPSGQERLFPLTRPLGARRTNCRGTEENERSDGQRSYRPERSLTQWIMNGEVAERASLNTNYPARFIGPHKHARTDSTYSGSLVVDTGWRIDWAVCVPSRKLIALLYRRLSRPYPCWRESTPTEEARAFLSSAHSAPGIRTISREVDLRHAGNFMIMSEPGLATPKLLQSTWILGFLPLMWKGWQSQLSRGKDWNWFSFPQRGWTVELGQERCCII